MNFYIPASGRFIDLLKFNSDNYGQLDGLSINNSSRGYKYETLNWSQYYSLVVKMCHHLLHNNVLNFGSNRPVIAFLSNPSTDYFFYNLSFMQLNIIPLHLSTRVNDDSLIHLLEKGKVSGLLVSQEFYERGLNLQSKLGHSAELFKMEDINYIRMMQMELSEDELEKVSSFINFSGQGDEIAYILHSTGSTSVHPKLISITNNVLFGQTSRNLLDEATYPRKDSLIVLLPLYHTGGQMFGFHLAIRWCRHIIASPNLKGGILNGAMILDLMDHVKFDTIIWMPKLLIELIDHCNAIPYAEGWGKMVKWGGKMEYGGATLPPEYVEQLVNNGLVLRSIYGATEIGMIAYSGIATKQDLFPKFTFPKESKIYMSEYDKAQGIYELVIEKDELGLFDRTENYRTKDLFKSLTWNHQIAGEYYLRADDVLVHVTGEKTNPIPMEDILNQCSIINRSVVLGKNHTLNHVLIQLNWDQVELIDWERAMKLVEEQIKLVNESSPSHSRLLPDCIHILDRSQEIKATVKGNVIRQVNYNTYKHLIEDIKVEAGQAHTDPDSAFLSVANIVSKALNLTQKIDPDEDFFKLGMDSLSALIVLKKLQCLFPRISFNVSQIYKLKTINNVMKYLNEKLEIGEDTIQSIQYRIDTMVNTYTSKFENYNDANFDTTGKRSVLVVGSNGSLACHFIHALLHRDDVDRVIGLMRGSKFEDKSSYQVSLMKEKGLFIHQRVLGKLQCFSANMLLPNFNLSAIIYQDIFDNMTEVAQVGWRMNFLSPLEDFEDCIETTSNLLKFCLQNTKNPKVFNFVSTIAPTIPTYKSEFNGIIPEIPTLGKITSLAGCTGYGLSKLVGEQICYHVAKSKSLPVKVFRVGELSGDQSLGQWNTKEFLPLLIRQIIKLKSYPDLSSKSISWVPIDLAGKSLADLGRLQTKKAELYTIVNPQKSEWKAVIDYIETSFNIKLQLISLDKFLNFLKSTKTDTEEIDVSQGLSDFLQDYLKDEGNIKISWEVSKTCEQTKYLANCPSIDNNLISKYFKYWLKLGYFN